MTNWNRKRISQFGHETWLTRSSKIQILRGCFLLLSCLLAAFFIPREGVAEELKEPPVCSPLKPIPPELKEFCEIKIKEGARHTVAVHLTAHNSQIEVGGYKVNTQHYNKTYLTPVIEAMPGDTVAAYLTNSLKPFPIGGGAFMSHLASAAQSSGIVPTNLHYFHGGIVSPNNARPKDAKLGDGDNIFVWLENGTNNTFALNVPIPGEGELDARVLEGEGDIAHPNGLNWYHSHLHGLSSAQVMGGMSGLLSVGDDKSAVKARCNEKVADDQCKEETKELQKRTIVRYALLRDISLENISATPIENNESKQADWAPGKVHFPDDETPDEICKVWDKKDSPVGAGDPRPERREGFCQRSPTSAWLFTINGQRYPTITVEEGKNLLLRLANVSPNVAYWLELRDKDKTIPLTILSIDGVVPAKPVLPNDAKIPVDAVNANELLLMPASRAEIYIRNDDVEHSEQTLVLRTKSLDVSDKWPEIQLAQIVLNASKPKRAIALALNVPIAQPVTELAAKVSPPPAEAPKGCVRDLNPGEHRRVTFSFISKTLPPPHEKTAFMVKTEVVGPPPVPVGGKADSAPEERFEPVDSETVEAAFEEYEEIKNGTATGSILWEGDGKSSPKHVCIHLGKKESHKQLWVLTNTTGMLHNFHIHQIKFRLATAQELRDHGITPPEHSSTCIPGKTCDGPNYELYDPSNSPNPKFTKWHDTIPVPKDGNQRVFIIMSFDAKQQIGRFVYHCHILKHEDVGLMAPIEVWSDASRLSEK